MKRSTRVVLLASLVCASAWGQDVSVYGTTLAQLWKEDVAGFDKKTYTPATQYLGIDASRLGLEGLSLHLFGWGRMDMADPSLADRESRGELSYGYLKYRFKQANAEIQAGRFTINQGVGVEQVDGVNLRADLRAGFTISAFGGTPVLYKTADPKDQSDYEFQRDVIFGTRVAHRSRIGEFGVSFLQDGSVAAKDLDFPMPIDYTRKQLGGDLRVFLGSAVDLSGRTVYDLVDRSEPAASTAPKPSRIAEHDYTLTVKVTPKVIVSGNITERNFQAYFAGTNLPSLFRQVEKDKHRAYGARVSVAATGSLEVVGDFRNTDRETYGEAKRFGADLRWTPADSKFRGGMGYHRVTADDVPFVGNRIPSYSLSHHELRVWVMVERGRLSATLDGIYHSYDDQQNPQLDGQRSVYEVVGSLGFQPTTDIKISADLGYGANASYKNEVRGVLRAEYRFGKGGK